MIVIFLGDLFYFLAYSTPLCCRDAQYTEFKVVSCKECWGDGHYSHLCRHVVRAAKKKLILLVGEILHHLGCRKPCPCN